MNDERKFSHPEEGSDVEMSVNLLNNTASQLTIDFIIFSPSQGYFKTEFVLID